MLKYTTSKSMRSIFGLSLINSHIARAQKVNLNDLTQITGTCFYETNEFYGSLPADAEYKTDLTLLRPDSYTALKVTSFKQKQQIQAVKLCKNAETEILVGIQLLLGVPSAAAIEAGEVGNQAFEEPVVLYGHGNSDTTQVTCDKLYLSPGEYVHSIQLQYSKVDGLDLVRLESSKGQKISAGSVKTSDQTKTVQFNESYQLVGLKGHGSATSLDSLGIIVYDTTCDVTDPAGGKLGEATTKVEPVVVPVVIIEEAVTVPETAVKESETDSSALIVAICAITGLVLVLALGIYCYCKHVKGKVPENSKKILAADDNHSVAEAAGLNVVKRKTGLEPMMKMRRAKTTLFRDFVPKSDLFADEETGNGKLKEDMTDYIGAAAAEQKSPVKRQPSIRDEMRVVDFPRQATIFRRQLTIQRQESVRLQQEIRSVSKTTDQADQEDSSMREDSIFNQTQQKMLKIEETEDENEVVSN